jgi:hypothetical protein
MTCRKCDDFKAPVREKRIGSDEERVGVLPTAETNASSKSLRELILRGIICRPSARVAAATSLWLTSAPTPSRFRSSAIFAAEVGLHTGEQQEHENAELRHRIDHTLLLGVPREDRVLQVRPKRA